MDSKLYAFRMAQPIDTDAGELAQYRYDPLTQTAIWTGSSKAIASQTCTVDIFWGGYQDCNAYGNYCATYGNPALPAHGYQCDELSRRAGRAICRAGHAGGRRR